MPIRFHRQFTLFPGVKVNVSKTGMSLTIGEKGFHLNLSKRGVMRTTNLPGKVFPTDHTSSKMKETMKAKRMARKRNVPLTSQRRKQSAKQRQPPRHKHLLPGFFPLFGRCVILYLLRRTGIWVVTPKPGDRLIKYTHAMGAAGGVVISWAAVAD